MAINSIESSLGSQSFGSANKNSWESQFECLGDIVLANGKKLGDVDPRFYHIFRSPNPTADEKKFLESKNINYDFRLNHEDDQDGLPDTCKESFSFACNTGGRSNERSIAYVMMQLNAILGIAGHPGSGSDPDGNILIHCEHGANRTGITVGALMLALGGKDVDFAKDVIPQIDGGPFKGSYSNVQELASMFYDGYQYNDPSQKQEPVGEQKFLFDDTAHHAGTTFSWSQFANAVPGGDYGSYDIKEGKWEGGLLEDQHQHTEHPDHQHPKHEHHHHEHHKHHHEHHKHHHEHHHHHHHHQHHKHHSK